MKISKIFSAVAAAALAVSTMAVSSLSVSAADSETVKLYSQNTNSWTLYESEALEISADGDYTMSLDAGGEENYITLYIKDVNAAKAPESFADVTLTVNSITVNGKALGLTKTEYEVVGNGGVFDVCFINGWADTFVTADACPFDNASDSSFSYGGPVNTFEVNFTISGLGGSAAAEEDTAAEDTAEEDTAAEDTAEDTAAEDTAVENTAAPASDSTTTAATTGNTAAASIAVVMVAAAAAMVVSKRK
ncbi:MAG: hypothetical protein ACI4KF_06600 [Huintestinicola sp.]